MKIWNTKGKRNYAIYLGIASLTVSLSFAVLLIVSEETQYQLTKEDGFFESVGAIGWFVASIVFFNSFWKNKSGNNLIFLRTKRNLVFCLLGIFCFVACGEEISWGQRIFKLKTPECLKKINRQGETNLHNIVFIRRRDADGKDLPFWARMLSMTKFFQASWFGYCVFLPLASRFGRQIYYYIKNVNIPLVPIGLSVVFLSNYLISKIIPFVYYTNGNRNDHYFVEVKECNFGILFMLVSFYFLQSIANSETDYEYATHSRSKFTGQSILAEDQRSVPALTNSMFSKTQGIPYIPDLKKRTKNY
jgi:hypothetical protein